MTKKRKLNSKNPKYSDKSQVTKQPIKVKTGSAKVRTSNGNLTSTIVKVQGVWY
tara:strand:- start:752 stop:913 length:162 start_codon:yes stop_codon:yes gene_type:complete